MFQSKKWKEENSYLKSEIISLTLSLESVKEENRILLKKLEVTESKSHNTRGAGRKKSILESDIILIRSLLDKDHKVSEIILILNKESEEKWTHSKVTYIKERYWKEQSSLDSVCDCNIGQTNLGTTSTTLEKESE